MLENLYHAFGNDIQHAAILIHVSSNETDAGSSQISTHTGIIYRNASEEQLRLIHFLLAGLVKTDNWRGRHAHVIPNAHIDSLDNLATVCRKISERHRIGDRSYDYRLSRELHPLATIDDNTGEIEFVAGTGATCSSFVLLLCSHVGIDLVVSGQDWPYRPGVDDVNHQRLLDLLVQHQCIDEDRATELQLELFTPRVAPEETAGAGLCPTLPASQAFAESAGRWIIATALSRRTPSC